MQIGVIGNFGTINGKKGIAFTKKEILLAEKLGEELGKNRATVILGGDDNGGLIEAVARGVKREKGTVVGFLVGKDKSAAMKEVDIAILSGMTFGGREYLLVLSCDVVIALKGSAGTLNEMTVAYQNKIPIIGLAGLGGWTDKLVNRYLDQRKRDLIYEAKTPKEAVSLAIRKASERKQ